MRLFLEIIDGPQKGEKIQVKKTSTLGRAGAVVVIEDPKLSQTHAVLEYNSKRQWFLQDKNSRNGVWVNGIRENRIQITNGMVFQVGSTFIKCSLVKRSSQKVGESFLDWLGGLAGRVKNEKSDLSEIKPEVRLRVIQGPQTGQSWDLFYGPRILGKDNPDLCLYDDRAPEQAFEIRVKRRYPYFHTDHPDKVIINEESITSKQLQPGDVIALGESQIIVEFDDGSGFSS
ncbi:MAG: FHA domain-containing protein [Bdellovibrionales bacterium]|nr:FHA domain-containing protein [Bdellovibrionales bacterium]